MEHWHGEISSNVTFAYCTKGCIDVAVLRGRPLTHVRSLSMQNLNPFISIFLSFFFTKIRREGAKGKKVRLIERKTHTFNDGSVDCKKTDSLRAKSLTSPASASLRRFLPYDLFFMRRDTFSILKACSYIFYLICAFGSHVT